MAGKEDLEGFGYEGVTGQDRRTLHVVLTTFQTLPRHFAPANFFEILIGSQFNFLLR